MELHAQKRLTWFWVKRWFRNPLNRWTVFIAAYVIGGLVFQVAFNR